MPVLWIGIETAVLQSARRVCSLLEVHLTTSGGVNGLTRTHSATPSTGLPLLTRLHAFAARGLALTFRARACPFRASIVSTTDTCPPGRGPTNTEPAAGRVRAQAFNQQPFMQGPPMQPPSSAQVRPAAARLYHRSRVRIRSRGALPRRTRRRLHARRAPVFRRMAVRAGD